MLERASRVLQAVIFDFDGVVAERGFHAALRALARRRGLAYAPLPALAMGTLADSGYLTGHGTEQDWWKQMQAALGPLGDSGQFCADVLAASSVRPWQLALARRLADAGYRTAILSDHTDWLDRIEEQQAFSCAFGQVLNSYYLGVSKREAAAFEAVLANLAVPAAAALFVDDNPANVTRASALGIHGIVYRDRETFLRELGGYLGGASAAP